MKNIIASLLIGLLISGSLVSQGQETHKKQYGRKVFVYSVLSRNML